VVIPAPHATIDKMGAAENSAFAVYARRKTDAALSARFEHFETLVDNSARLRVEPIGCAFTDALLDGPFFESMAAPTVRPVMNLVFVQSADGNTEADDPATLGGGETDKHVIYEGLSRVSADAVMAGANSIRHGTVVFSVWHPEFVAARRSFGKPRHPVQIVVTSSGELPIEEALLFNAAEVRVLILTAKGAAESLAERVRSRPWVTVISSGARPDLRVYAERLFALGIHRVSAVGGRKLATGLIDSSLISDVYLTTSPIEAGIPGSPMYEGTRWFSRNLVIRKRSSENVVFEHFIMRSS
jgi:riboflavin biosynthesis pyrimidine reductase